MRLQLECLHLATRRFNEEECHRYHFADGSEIRRPDEVDSSNIDEYDALPLESATIDTRNSFNCSFVSDKCIQTIINLVLSKSLLYLNKYIAFRILY